VAGRRGLTLAVPTSRVARRTDPLAFSRIAPEDAWTDAGNRFDIPGAGVLYAADTVRASTSKPWPDSGPHPASWPRSPTTATT
jgi:hypothetical protein